MVYSPAELLDIILAFSSQSRSKRHSKELAYFGPLIFGKLAWQELRASTSYQRLRYSTAGLPGHVACSREL